MRRRRSARFCFDESSEGSGEAAAAENTSFVEQEGRIRLHAKLRRGKVKAETLKDHGSEVRKPFRKC